MFEPAPLVATDAAPIPPGGEAEWFQGAGGTRLRAALFTPEGRVRGSVVLSPGRTEAIEKYYEVIGELLERGFVVLAHDWRGQGLSARELPDRLKGHARGYKPFLEDFAALLRAFEARLPKPWIMLSHSMGATLTLLAMIHGERRFAGALLSAPMFGVKTGKVPPLQARVSAWMQNALGRSARYLPGQARDPFAQDFETNVLTHDRARFARNVGLLTAEPQLALGAPTWGWLQFALSACAELARPERLRGITIPVMILQAEDERLVDNAAQAAAALHLLQGQLIRVPGAYHEILMETDLMRNFFLRVLDTLTGRTAPKPAASPRPPEAPKPVGATKPAPAPEPAPAPAPVPEVTPIAAASEVVPPASAVATPAPAPKKAAPPKKAVGKKPPAAKAAAKPAAKPAAAKATAAKKAPATAAPAKPAVAGVNGAKSAGLVNGAKPAAAKPAAARPAAKAPAKTAAPKAAPAKAAAAKAVPAKAAAKAAAPKTAPKAAAPKAAAAKAATPKAAAAPKPAAKKPAAKKPAAPKKA